MKYLLAILLLCGCSVHQSFDSTQCALTQDSIFAGQAPVSHEKRFKDYMKAQRLIETTNLTIRDDAINGRWTEANKGVDRLTVGLWWAEGLSYAKYVQMAYVWDNHDARPSTLWYTNIAGPDSTVPIPETRSTDKVVPSRAAFYRDSSFAVWRTDSTYVLIGLQTSWPLRKNQHVRPTGFAYWANGKWINRVPAYDGYRAEDQVLDECQRGNTLPCGPFGPLWRISPPVVKVLHADTDGAVIRYGGVTRWYVVRDGQLTVEE